MKVEDLLKMDWGSAVDWMLEHQDHVIVEGKNLATVQAAVETMVHDLATVNVESDEKAFHCARRVLARWDRNRGSAWFK